MPVFDGASDQPEYTPPEVGRYIATLKELKDAPDRGWGIGAQWVFTLAELMSGVTLVDADGKDEELWQFTSTKMSPKARARPFVEALLGRPLDIANREAPDPRLLVGKSMLCVLIHEKADDGSVRARLTSCTPYVPSTTTPVAAPPRQAAPPSPTEDALKAEVKAAIKKAERLATARHLDWLGLDVDRMTQVDLQFHLCEIQADILTS